MGRFHSHYVKREALDLGRSRGLYAQLLQAQQMQGNELDSAQDRLLLLGISFSAQRSPGAYQAGIEGGQPSLKATKQTMDDQRKRPWMAGLS